MHNMAVLSCAATPWAAITVHAYGDTRWTRTTERVSVSLRAMLCVGAIRVCSTVTPSSFAFSFLLAKPADFTIRRAAVVSAGVGAFIGLVGLGLVIIVGSVLCAIRLRRLARANNGATDEVSK